MSKARSATPTAVFIDQCCTQVTMHPWCLAKLRRSPHPKEPASVTIAPSCQTAAAPCSAARPLTSWRGADEIQASGLNEESTSWERRAGRAQGQGAAGTSLRGHPRVCTCLAEALAGG